MLDVPEPPWDVRIAERGSRTLKVSWREPVDNNSPILYYCVLYRTDEGITYLVSTVKHRNTNPHRKAPN